VMRKETFFIKRSKCINPFSYLNKEENISLLEKKSFRLYIVIKFLFLQRIKNESALSLFLKVNFAVSLDERIIIDKSSAFA